MTATGRTTAERTAERARALGSRPGPPKPPDGWRQRYLREWFGNVRPDLLSGLVVALALIPEAIGFSIIAGVDPKVGLYASFSIAVVSAFFGGRPGMISAATGAMALLMVGLVKDHGLPYLFAATVLTGVFQVVFGYLKLSRYLRFVPRSVMVGFVNALALLIFSAQLPQFAGQGWPMYAMTAAGLAVIYLLPRIFRAIPSALIAIGLLTAVAVLFHVGVRRVGDMGDLPAALPFFSLPQVPISWATLGIIAPISATLALVGLLESLLTANLIDERTDTRSDKHQEARGQGLSNIVTGFLGGMAGCAMIGQSMINVGNGGRGRLSTFVAGVVLLLLIVVLQPFVVQIPMAALVAVMIVVSVNTFDWGSITPASLKRQPRGESVVMFSTVGVTLLTHNLSAGVLVGVLLSALMFARQVSRQSGVQLDAQPGGVQRYRVQGQLFFVSTQDFLESFDFHAPASAVVIDLSGSHLWDGSAVAALERVVQKYRRAGVPVSVEGLNEASATLLGRLGQQDQRGDQLGAALEQGGH